MTRCLLLSKSFQPIMALSAIRAFCLVLSGRAVVEKLYEDKFVTTVDSRYRLPCVIRTIMPIPYRHMSFSITRESLFLRDNYTCQYCGRDLSRQEATIDHVTPKSRGGGFEWTNLVTSCNECNQKKGGRTPKEARMVLQCTPGSPSQRDFLSGPWEEYLW